ncbi:MAG: hypothetical protein EOP45_05945 [Sphingobacteriaceae bacterium]|nr:MAG: hypothetical protein EOP45_05945 [Sphingobacteriaceae bacterium]
MTIVLDQVSTIDKSRLTKHIGVINSSKAQEIFNVLIKMFTF